MFSFPRHRRRQKSNTQRKQRKIGIFEHLEDRTVLSGTPIGFEQLINTTVSGDQRLVAIGSHPSATQTVMVWASAGEDGSGDGVYAQRYDHFGSKIGSSFRINTFTSGNQTSPAIAMDSLGSFVVTWQSAGQDGSGDGIYARRYGYDGTALAAEFRVNSTTSGNQQAPTIAMNDAGNFAIAWQTANRDGNGNAVAARAYNAAGTALGNDFQVNQFTSGNQQAPSIAMANDASFTIAWQSATQDSNGDAVVARRYSTTAVALANEFIVNQTTTGNQSAPSIAANPDGSFVIAWQSAGQDGNGEAIVARQYNAAGSPLANEFIVNQFTTGNQSNPSIATHPVAGFVIAWQSAGQDGNLDGVVARNYSSAGTSLGNEFIINTVSAGDQNNPVVTIDPQGDFIVAWQSAGQETGGGTSLGAIFRRYNVANDAPIMRQIANQASDVGGTISFTASARDADGSLDTLTYSLLAGAPAGMTINPSTGLVTWDSATSGATAGRYFATLRATDSSGTFDDMRVALTLFAPGERSPLDDYVNAIDPAYNWDIRSRVDGDGFTKYNVRLTSGTWRTSAEVNNPLWQHWLILYVPDVITKSQAFMFIDGGSASATPTNTRIDPYAGGIAATSGMVVAGLLQVPNQPLTFAGETASRSEDSIIAYSWRKYSETGDPTWPVNLPMTRAAMRAMDAVIDFVGSPVGGNANIDSFMVSGGSKRGWTTWLAAATDPRVTFAVPIVADLLNMEVSFAHHYSYYNGTFSAAVNDYVNEGILNPNNFGDDTYKNLLKIVDPFTYKDRLTLPKFLINASGDEFFVPDSWQFYYDQLPGPKWIRYVANSGHSISDPLVLIEAFTLLIAAANNYQPPSYSFTQLPDGTIEVQTAGTVADAKLYQATNVNAREFRNAVVGGIFTSTQLSDQGGGVFRANVPTPPQGWTAYFIQLSFQNPFGGLATVSSGVYFKGPPANKQPDVTPTPDTIVTEGSFSVPIVATDPDTNQTITYSLDPGGPAGVTINPVTGVVSGFANDQLGLLAPITVVVSDNGTPIISYRDTFRITVVNAAPTADISAQSDAVRGEPIPFTFSATDPSPVDQAAGFTYEIDWDNDNIVDVTQSGGSSINLNRVFPANGTYEIRARVMDKDGGVSNWTTHNLNVSTYRTAPNPNNGSLTDLIIGGLPTEDGLLVVPGFLSNPSATPDVITFVNFSDPAGSYDIPGVTGRVVVYAQGGDDLIVVVGNGTGPLSQTVWLYGGDGNDTFTTTDLGAPLVIYGEAGNDFIAGVENGAFIFVDGGDGSDFILGSGFADTIYGGEGDDAIVGGFSPTDAGDLIYGGEGRDLVLGGFGADTIFGGTGSDFLMAGALGDEPPEGFNLEWWSTNDYATRTNNILSGGGGLISGPMVPGVHIIDDGAADVVYGEADEDFFWVNLTVDTTPDQIVSETRVSL
jgi:PhoPQ-activated pathogenicity-related protein